MKLKLLKDIFGYTQFRPGQESLIDGVLSGRDVFGIMPTGGGKSICYQLAGLMLPGLTVVVSPLISLMQDQVLALKAAGVPAAYLNSTLNPAQVRAVYRNLYAGKYKILYVAPERLDYEGLAALSEQVPISFVAVDEAHCISQWGQDFRPSYMRIVQFIDRLKYRPVVGAYTATATRQVQEDIVRILKLNDPVIRLLGYDRPNLFFDVLRPEDKNAWLLRLLSARKRKCGIIYCSTRKNVESVCELLKDHGFRATRYHAGLSEEERSRNQEDFLYDRKTVMVATNAFGMGIDKSNVSFVIHYNMPKSIEAYYQEAGRAGRDGTAADCILLFSDKDVRTARYLISNGSDNEELTDAQRELIRQQDFARLEAMIRYCQSEQCLRGFILEYFGQKHPEFCGNCGSCQGEFESVDVTREAQMILSCVKRIRDAMGYYVGISTVGRTLRGSRDKRILEQKLDQLPTYGIMKEKTRSEIHELADHLEAAGYLFTDPEHKTLVLKPEAAQVLYHGKTVTMLVRKEPEQQTGEAKPEKLSGEDALLMEALKELRAKIAKENHLRPYMVFSNATLEDMANKKPVTMGAFRKVSGVGVLKSAWYGKEFIARIKQYLSEGE